MLAYFFKWKKKGFQLTSTKKNLHFTSGLSNTNFRRSNENETFDHIQYGRGNCWNRGSKPAGLAASLSAEFYIKFVPRDY